MNVNQAEGVRIVEVREGEDLEALAGAGSLDAVDHTTDSLQIAVDEAVARADRLIEHARSLRFIGDIAVELCHSASLLDHHTIVGGPRTGQVIGAP